VQGEVEATEYGGGADVEFGPGETIGKGLESEIGGFYPFWS